ncbi:hypothetical protein MMC22_004051 [Lobaria immixta]|nr:hypothetical protein [Lobaria immixta]
MANATSGVEPSATNTQTGSTTSTMAGAEPNNTSNASGSSTTEAPIRSVSSASRSLSFDGMDEEEDDDIQKRVPVPSPL